MDALTELKLRSAIKPEYGVDITLKTADGLKVLFIPCGGMAYHARLLRNRIVESDQLDGLPIVASQVTIR